ncbi:MAG: hypothetical protein DI498_05125 [Paracoccus denitrificans]|nr:MAG: hypothetical protein DI498_05125 [Paracoccus denitrificans]PZO85298.1 MAG: hypothetical protein DI633_05125 [Paracoccus denitrificans]
MSDPNRTAPRPGAPLPPPERSGVSWPLIIVVILIVLAALWYFFGRSTDVAGVNSDQPTATAPATTGPATVPDTGTTGTAPQPGTAPVPSDATAPPAATN